MKLKIISITLLVLLTSVFSLYKYVSIVPDYNEDLKLKEALLFSDGGSMSVVFENINGKEFYFGIKAELEEERKNYPLFFVRDTRIPYAHFVSINSKEEKEFMFFLEAWLNKNVSKQAMEKFKNKEFDSIPKQDWEKTVVYSIYEQLSNRNKP